MKKIVLAGMVAALAWIGPVEAQSVKFDYSAVLKPRKERQFQRDWYAPYSLASPITRNMISDVRRIGGIMATVSRYYIQRTRESTKKIEKALSRLADNERYIMTFFSRSIYDFITHQKEFRIVEYSVAKPYSQREYLGEMRANMDHHSVKITPPLKFDNLICYINRREWGRNRKSLPPFHKFFVKNGLGIEAIRSPKNGNLPLCFVRYEGEKSHRNDMGYLSNAAWFTIYSVEGLADVSEVYQGDVWVLSGEVLSVSKGRLVTIRLKSHTVIGHEVIP